ncbi:MAG: hypothetical protein HYS69_17145 [candidate division NC10 bacterium]|nr:hypothetical protein [candidate division NC10 bacterium]
MIGASVFFRDLAYVLLAAVLGGGIARIARQPLILGYVLGGILVSPLTPGPAISEVHTFELFAEIGVILLIGLTLVEDLAVVVLVMLMPALGAPATGFGSSDSRNSLRRFGPRRRRPSSPRDPPRQPGRHWRSPG